MASLPSRPRISLDQPGHTHDGRPCLVKPVRVGANRRDFFKRSGSAAAALASAPMLTLGSAQARVARDTAEKEHNESCVMQSEHRSASRREPEIWQTARDRGGSGEP